jgi:hypothetical protein
MGRTPIKEIRRIDALLRILARHRLRATDPTEICRCMDVIDMHLDERLTYMDRRSQPTAA